MVPLAQVKLFRLLDNYQIDGIEKLLGPYLKFVFPNLECLEIESGRVRENFMGPAKALGIETKLIL